MQKIDALFLRRIRTFQAGVHHSMGAGCRHWTMTSHRITRSKCWQEMMPAGLMSVSRASFILLMMILDKGLSSIEWWWFASTQWHGKAAEQHKLLQKTTLQIQLISYTIMLSLTCTSNPEGPCATQVNTMHCLLTLLQKDTSYSWEC